MMVTRLTNRRAQMRRLLAAATPLAVALALAGCGVAAAPHTTTNSPAPSAATAAPSAATATPTATPTPVVAGPVTLSVTGSAPVDDYGHTVSIDYGSDTISDSGGTSVPWSATLLYIQPSSDTNLDYEVDGTLTDVGGSITCCITVQGKVFSSTATGADQMCMEDVSPTFSGSGWSAN